MKNNQKQLTKLMNKLVVEKSGSAPKATAKKAATAKKTTAKKSSAKVKKSGLTTTKAATKQTTTKASKKKLVRKSKGMDWEAIRNKIDQNVAKKLKEMNRRNASLGRVYADDTVVTVGILKEVMPTILNPIIEPITKRLDKVENGLDGVKKELGGLSNSLGTEAEQYFADLVSYDYEFGKKFPSKEQEVLRNVICKSAETGKKACEFDIVVVNKRPQRILIIEVKRKLILEDIRRMMDSPLAIFFRDYPQYKNYPVHFGFAAYIFDSGALSFARKHKCLIFRKSQFNPYEFPENPKNFNENKTRKASKKKA